MSIRINEAYRFPLKRLGEATDFLHQYFYEESYAIFSQAALEAWESGHELPTKPVMESVRQHIEMNTNDCLNLSRSFDFWVYESHVLLIPSDPVPDSVRPDWFEGFDYQDSTDVIPSGISEEEYWKRGAIWAAAGAFKRPGQVGYCRYCHEIVGVGDLRAFERKWVKEFWKPKQLV